MNDTTQTEGRNRCPKCGLLLREPGAAGMCTACLMSGVLRADEHPTASMSSAETLPVDPRQGSTGGATRATQLPFELPFELGDYTLVAPLGRGGMGTVYEAVQRSTGRRLALKLLAQSLDSPEMRQRFLREGRLAARVNHPSSLYVFGSEEIDGLPVITMEIAPGGTLQDALDRRGPLPVQEAVDAVLNMIDGLEAALDRGVLHRDIKPSNCFLAPDGTVQVGDFGLSVSTLPSADSFLTQTGKVLGTPAFASPEQLRGDEVDVRSDIYAVGATLFTLLTARAPFEGDNAVQVVANVIDTPPADIAEFRDDLPAGLASVVTRCLAKEAGARFAGYGALRDALLPFSSVVPEPATQSQRTAAGWIDYLAAFLPAYATMMVVVGPERLFVLPLYDFSFEAWRYHLLVFAAGFVYFGVLEGLFGAGLGKWVMNLRVTRRGKKPGVVRALLRIAVPIAVVESVRIPLSVVTLPAGDWTALNMLVFTGIAIFAPWVAAVLWMPARRSNGLATVWDLITGTRVVVRPRGSSRPSEQRSVSRDPSSDSEKFVGPYRFVSDRIPGMWMEAEDPVLRRSVWIIRRDDAVVSDARRAVARPGRSRWLQEIGFDGAAWDAYEADRGSPLRDRLVAGQAPWSTLRYWLHDIAAELRASERDGTLLPACGFDHVWITDDGRAMLLDTPWPADKRRRSDRVETVRVDSLEGQQRFLSMIACEVDPLSVPLHAQPVLQNIRSGSFEKMTFLTGTLKGLLHKPAELHAGLRGASLFVIPGYATIATFLGIASNTDPSVGPLVWVGRAAIAALVMMHFIAFFDFVLAFWQKSTGLTTFGLELVTPDGRATRARYLRRSAIMWLPIVLPTAVLGGIALANGTWIPFGHAVILAAVGLALAAVGVGSALINPARGLHDRLAGVWVGRR